MAIPGHLITGYRGEQLAARYLREKGYDVIASSFESKAGETDIIALSPEKTLCFTEVKTRSPGGMFPPSEAVDAGKRQRLELNASAFTKIYRGEYSGIRFDIIEVVLKDLDTAEINLIENAF